ncbi:MAG: hypothetical protein K9N47_18550 [Prosthecobacter sp.]|uniref:hypothetical protein n=1 Tax=Prosthecobacter sp. TaxID=1965333 RepID=UPI0025F53A3C|nr:hypothetical protein [Prosthecobacter sp.]MCF7788130.1 hypothetical protein [Prosthecobacter sp.]
MLSTPDDFKHRPRVDDEKAGEKAATKRVPLSAGSGLVSPKTSERAKALSLPAIKGLPKIQRSVTPEVTAAPADSWRVRWEKWGGRSLALSIVVHVLILSAGALIVVHHVTDRQMDFIPGGGSVQGAQAEEALLHKIQQKKNPWLKKAMPNRKLAVADRIKDVMVLTDVPDMPDLPQASKPMGGGAFSGGFGLAGAVGNFGKGMGLGAKSGVVLGPLFGLTIQAKKLAVVLDVSSSMMPHLERVVSEVDKVAKGSVVVLYFGCGLEAPSKPLVGTKIFRTTAVEFEKFWRLGGATYMETAQYKIDTRKLIPSKELFLKLSRRPQTYFIHNVGVGYTWLALLSDEVRNADGLYWFSDFQDVVEPKQMSVVLDNLKLRKQRLYIHSSGKGEYFDLVKDKLVVPTEGDSYIEK